MQLCASVNYSILQDLFFRQTRGTFCLGIPFFLKELFVECTGHWLLAIVGIDWLHLEYSENKNHIKPKFIFDPVYQCVMAQ